MHNPHDITRAASQAIGNAGGIDALARDILSLSEDCAIGGREYADPFEYGSDTDNPTPIIEIRLRIQCDLDDPTADPTDPDEWSVSINTGSPDFDTDHRGWCSAGYAWATYEGTISPDDEDDDPREVFAPMARTEAREEAERMVSEVMDILADSIH